MPLRDLKGDFRYSPRRILTSFGRRVGEPVHYAKLLAQARTSSQRITDPQSDVVVSMTTHGSRLEHVHLTIETIARGTMLPRRFILFLDEPIPRRFPAGLQRLLARGLEIKTTVGGYGPHTKYYPFVAEISHKSPDYILVTADDDVVYPRTWLQDLRRSYRPGASEVLCHRAHRIKLIDGSIAPYNSWHSAKSTSPSILNMATGVSGVLYSPEIQEAMRRQGEGFRERAPKADDVWLHWVALQAGFRVRQIRPIPLNLPNLWRSQKSSLVAMNSYLAKNDDQIRLCYSQRDVQKLRSFEGR